jgi:hypothetical protein
MPRGGRRVPLRPGLQPARRESRRSATGREPLPSFLQISGRPRRPLRAGPGTHLANPRPNAAGRPFTRSSPTGPADNPPRQRRPTRIDFDFQKKISIRPPNSRSDPPDDVIGGQPPRGPLGGGFSKIFEPINRLSPRPRAEVFAFFGTAPSRFVANIPRDVEARAALSRPFDAGLDLLENKNRARTAGQISLPTERSSRELVPES